MLSILFWRAGVRIWHRWLRPTAGTLEVHCRLDLPGSYTVIALFELSMARPATPSEDGGSEGRSFTHSLFGSTASEEDVEVEVPIADGTELESDEDGEAEVPITAGTESEYEEVEECD